MKISTGAEFYDNDEAFLAYTKHRQQKENANDTIEKPAILQLLGDVTDANVLDLGCGNAGFGAELLEQGCFSYTGVDGSINMINAAQQQLLNYPNARVLHESMEHYTPPRTEYDLVTARLSLHYMEDLASIFTKVNQSLKPEGRFIFSVEHPVITSTLQPSALRTNWTVDNYFSMGFRQQHWMGGYVQKYHRTLEEYFSLMQQSGFTVTNLKEACPQQEHFDNVETYERRMRIPLFLLMSGVKNR
ncbi:class I SAM-dependent methyltransferase [Priestia megaterium]|uniref:class I SAM-dependent DNA methyltransferase n=1 Tax=Priestia megaterium TaxID=1404 RepID=UPI002E23F23B|nr:class I SAM-dependent methyltransferase [Priestia megaterium]